MLSSPLLFCIESNLSHHSPYLKRGPSVCLFSFAVRSLCGYAFVNTFESSNIKCAQNEFVFIGKSMKIQIKSIDLNWYCDVHMAHGNIPLRPIRFCVAFVFCVIWWILLGWERQCDNGASQFINKNLRIKRLCNFLRLKIELRFSSVFFFVAETRK